MTPETRIEQYTAARAHQGRSVNSVKKRRLGDMLVEAGLINAEQLEKALIHQQNFGGRLGGVLVTLGMLSEQDLESKLALQLGLQTCDVESINPSPEVLKLLPEMVIRRCEVIPLSVQNRVMVLGMTDPCNMSSIDEVLFRTNMRKVEPRLLTETTFRRFVATRYASMMLIDQIATDNNLDPAAQDMDDETRRRILREDPDAALPLVIRLTNYILKQAVGRRASDIHIEPYETFFRVRYRVDGLLSTELTPALRLHPPLTSRLKILAGMDISERRKPQDGQISLRLNDEQTQFRISTLPTVFGEKTVLRLMKKEAHLADLGRLGFSPGQLTAIRKASKLSQGLILVTGPTGSGKTTTLHAMLNYVNDPDINIITLEDPVEQAFPGANHVQVSEKAGLTFPVALRSVLRQDPNVILIGEMRDKEVASIAIRAALTGHLVLSTLHTNGIVETFNRLTDMGLETYLIASCLQLVVAQRLLRRLCPHCAKPKAIPVDTVREFRLSPKQIAAAHHRVATGCKRCNESGYKGRLAVYELLSPDVALRNVLRENAGEQLIQQACNRAGVVWLWSAGIERALAGETSFEEVRRILTPPEGIEEEADLLTDGPVPRS